MPHNSETARPTVLEPSEPKSQLRNPISQVQLVGAAIGALVLLLLAVFAAKLL
jgi:hypothetical protein